MTDEQIIKASEYCSTDVRENTCPKCAFYKKHRCSTLMLNAVSDLINRQKAEIERLERKANTPFCQVTFDEEKLKEIANEYAENIEFDLNQLKSEVIKEFAERLKTNFNKNIRLYGRCTVYDATTEIDDLVKEMTEGKK